MCAEFREYLLILIGDYAPNRSTNLIWTQKQCDKWWVFYDQWLTGRRQHTHPYAHHHTAYRPASTHIEWSLCLFFSLRRCSRWRWTQQSNNVEKMSLTLTTTTKSNMNDTRNEYFFLLFFFRFVFLFCVYFDCLTLGARSAFRFIFILFRRTLSNVPFYISIEEHFVPNSCVRTLQMSCFHFDQLEQLQVQRKSLQHSSGANW